MTRVWMALMIGLAMLGARAAKGQENVTLTIFRSADSVTVYLSNEQPLVNLSGLQFQTADAAGRPIVQPLETLPGFLGFPYATIPTPICFHITGSAAPAAPPLECQIITTVTQTLVDANVFWFDQSSRQERTLTIVLYSLPRICPAGQVRCDLTYPVPTPTATPEILALTSTIAVPTELSPTPAITQLVTNFTGNNEDWTPIIRAFDGVEMVLVPAGCFMMGSDTNPASNEYPAHEICFDTPFWIDRYEVTRAMYRACVSEGSCDETLPSQYSTEPEQPINRISWFLVVAFCDWRGARLPTEAEWEYAARGPSNWVYPWFGEFVADNVVFNENSNNHTAVVGSRPSGASWVGALDMSGNVLEWVSSIYQPYPYDESDGRENRQNTSSPRVLRGGSFIDTIGFLRARIRSEGYPPDANDRFGFRCARDYVEGDLTP